jgi:hypothetical protein
VSSSVAQVSNVALLVPAGAFTTANNCQATRSGSSTAGFAVTCARAGRAAMVKKAINDTPINLATCSSSKAC